VEKEKGNARLTIPRAPGRSKRRPEAGGIAELPNLNAQITNSFQTPDSNLQRPRHLGSWSCSLVLGICLRFGGWDFLAHREEIESSIDKVVLVPDLHATLLQALGLDHERLTYPHAGRDDSLTDVVVSKAKPEPELLA
jgi:hypothetical protein